MSAVGCGGGALQSSTFKLFNGRPGQNENEAEFLLDYGFEGIGGGLLVLGLQLALKSLEDNSTTGPVTHTPLF